MYTAEFLTLIHMLILMQLQSFVQLLGWITTTQEDCIGFGTITCHAVGLPSCLQLVGHAGVVLANCGTVIALHDAYDIAHILHSSELDPGGITAVFVSEDFECKFP